MRRLLLLLLAFPCLAALKAHAVNCDMTPGFAPGTATSAITAAKQSSCTHTAISAPITMQVPNGYNSFQSMTFPLANIVYFTAGSTNISSYIDVPCVSGQATILVTGPPKADETNLDVNPTATINGPVANDVEVHVESCTQSGATVIANLELNGNRPNTCNSCVTQNNTPTPVLTNGNIDYHGNSTALSGGGGGIYLGRGISNVYIVYNYIHGNQGGANQSPNSALIYADGLDTGSGNNYVASNIYIGWNQLGSESPLNPNFTGLNDCSNITNVTNYNGVNYGDSGSAGFCVGIGVHTHTNNFQAFNNRIWNQEDGYKQYDGGSGNKSDGSCCVYYSFLENGMWSQADDIQYVHRNPIEWQGRGQGAHGMTSQYDDMWNVASPANAGLMFSVPSCCGGTSVSGAPTITFPNYTNVLDDLIVANTGNEPMAIEFWSQGSASYNLIQGNIAGAINWAYTSSTNGGPMHTDYNRLDSTTAGQTYNPEANVGVVVEEGSCAPKGNRSICPAPANTSGNTFGVGNVYSLNNTSLSQVQSAAPTLSPASGTAISGLTTITLTDAGLGTNNTTPIPRGNTSIYYTTDGSTPTTSSKFCGTGSCQITVSPGTVVKAIGMWGSRNQPKSYPGFGFSPSGVVTATYPSSGGAAPTLSSIAVSLPASSLTAGGTGETATAQCNYSDGTHYDCSTGATPYGHGPVTFSTSDSTIATITAGPGAGAGVITPVAAGSANISATLGVLHATDVSLAVVASGPAALILGQNLNDYPGVTYANAFNSVYYVTTATYAPGNCHLVLPGAVTFGKHYDCLLISAPTATTEATTAICKGTYTTSGTAAPGTITIPMTGCPSTIAAGAYWVATITDDPSGPISMGFYDCGGTGVCQTTTPPTSGAGTYKGFWASVTYGSYGSLPSTFNGQNAQQPTQWIDLTATGSGMNLVSAYQDNTGSVNTFVKGTGYQQHVYCKYADNVILQCDFPNSTTTDARGSKVTAWSESSGGTVLTIGAAGGATEGLFTTLNYGFSLIGCTVTGGIPCSPYQLYVIKMPAAVDSYTGMHLSGMSVH